MLGGKLRVEQPEPAGAKAREQMHERRLRGVARAMEHAFAEEGAAQAHPIKAADQGLALVGLDRMGMAGCEQFTIEPHDLAVDPGLLPLGAGAHDRFERAVGDHPIPIRPDRLGEAARDDEPVERKDPAHPGARPRTGPWRRGFRPSERRRSNRPGAECPPSARICAGPFSWICNRGTARASRQAGRRAAGWSEAGRWRRLRWLAGPPPVYADLSKSSYLSHRQRLRLNGADHDQRI